MMDVIISEVRVTGESAGECVRETVSLAFSKVAHKYINKAAAAAQ
jgi:type VI protein secretion system component Hcp